MPLSLGVFTVNIYIIIEPFLEAVSVKIKIDAFYFLRKRKFAGNYAKYKKQTSFHWTIHLYKSRNLKLIGCLHNQALTYFIAK